MNNHRIFIIAWKSSGNGSLFWTSQKTWVFPIQFDRAKLFENRIEAERELMNLRRRQSFKDKKLYIEEYEDWR